MTETPDAARSTPKPPSADALRKLSVNVRWRAYEALRTFGPMTSRQLGKRVRVTDEHGNRVRVAEGIMAAHLREMESIGFVTSSGDPQRPRSLQWSAVRGGVDLDEFDRTESYARAASGWMKVFLASESDLAVDWVDAAPSWPKEWRTAAENADVIVRLSVDELREVAEEMRALMEKIKVLAKERPVDDPRYRAVVAITHAFPYPDEY